MADERKKFAAKRRDFFIRCIKTPVNDRKSKQDKNLQNPLRTRAKNKRGPRNYPLRENTLHHPNGGKESCHFENLPHAKWSNFNFANNTQKKSTKFSRMLGEDEKII